MRFRLSFVLVLSCTLSLTTNQVSAKFIQSLFHLAPTISTYLTDTIPTNDSIAVQAQNINPLIFPVVDGTNSSEITENSNQKTYHKNNFKFNISALAFNNYAFAYERSLSSKISFQFGYRYMPVTNMANTPLSKQLSKYIDYEDIEEELENLNVSGYGITPEFRFYMGRKKKGARGLYTSIYGRFSSYKFDYEYLYSGFDSDYIIPFVGDAKVYGVGIGFGAQFLIAKRIVLDLYILGAHFSKIKGSAFGETDLSMMSDSDKADLEEELQFEFNGKQLTTAVVSDNGVKLNIDGPFAGIRGLGLSIGIAF